MSRNKKNYKQESNCFYVSRDKLCPFALSLDDLDSCKLPHTHEYECTYTVVYNTSHLQTNHYGCGCIIYHNMHYHEFKYPEVIWNDFFHEGINPGQKNIKYTIRKCNKK